MIKFSLSSIWSSRDPQNFWPDLQMQKFSILVLLVDSSNSQVVIPELSRTSISYTPTSAWILLSECCIWQYLCVSLPAPLAPMMSSSFYLESYIREKVNHCVAFWSGSDFILAFPLWPEGVMYAPIHWWLVWLISISNLRNCVLWFYHAILFRPHPLLDPFFFWVEIWHWRFCIRMN